MIGIFDSGVGGLTVVKEIQKRLPGYQIIYFGDTARLPYGTKGAGFVQKYSSKIVNWLLDNGAKIIIIACHTSSAWASENLKRHFKNAPIFEMIAPAIKEALKRTKNKKIGIIGTPGTVKSQAYERGLLSIDSGLEVYPVACPLFVPLVEEGWISKKITKEIAEEYLKPLKKKKIDTLVLACTHYPLLKKTIRRVLGPEVKIINPAESLAEELSIYLAAHPETALQIKKGNDHRFFFSDAPYNLKKISQICFNQEIVVRIEDPF